MSFFIAIVVVVVFIVLAALISGSIIYFQYCNSPVKHWSNKVIALLGNARGRLRAEQRSFERLVGEERAEAERMTEKAFRKFLTHFGVDQLEAYPGIGAGRV